MWWTGLVATRVFNALGAAESTLYWHNQPNSSEDTPRELTHQDNIRLTRHLYGRQTRAGEIIIGGDRQLSSVKTPDKEGIEVNRNHAIEIFPFLRELPIKRTWAGLMPFTRNLDPIIGKIPPLQHLYILTGLGSSGFEHAPRSRKLGPACIHTRETIPLLSAA